MAVATARAMASAPKTLLPVKLTVFNPSPYKRGGIVVTQFKPIAERMGGYPDGVRVFREVSQSQRVELQAQLDRLVLDDRSRDQLVFALDEPLPIGKDDYSKISAFVTVEPASAPAPPAAGDPTAEPFGNGVKFLTGPLNVWLNTAANRNRADDNWFGGAVATVQVNDFELLDALAAFFGRSHHQEKRAMQLDRVHLVRPPWDKDGSVDENLFDKPWRCVNAIRPDSALPSRTAATGPLRATATIVSKEFDFACKDIDQHERVFTCSVYRAISVFRDRDLIGEQIWVNGIIEGSDDSADLWFCPRFFMMMQLALRPITFRYPDHPGWFALSSPELPHNGYAFATDANAGPIWNPPLDYPDRDTAHRAYSWELGATRYARAFHIFRRDTNPQALSDAAGWAWYELAYRPIIAA